LKYVKISADKKTSFKSILQALVTLHHEGTSSYCILTKFNFCNFKASWSNFQADPAIAPCIWAKVFQLVTEQKFHNISKSTCYFSI